MKKKVSLMIIVILIMQVLLPMLTVMWESNFTLMSKAAETKEATVDGITWVYELDSDNNAINVKPKDINSLPPEVTIPSKLDNYNVKSIGHAAFYNCEGIISINIPESVTNIEGYAFKKCINLESINISGSISTIGNETFNNCTSLTSIIIPESVTNIGNWAFSDCKSLVSINIPERVESIGEYAFCNCVGITSINIPNNVVSIGKDAFNGCKNIKSITIPKSVENIGEFAFLNCNSLTSINVDNNNSYYCSIDGVLYNKNKTEIISYPIKKERNRVYNTRNCNKYRRTCISLLY